MIHEVAVEIGSNCRIKENVWLAAYGGRIMIGDRVLVGRNSVIHGHGGVSIGEDSMLGPGVTILTAAHGDDLSPGATSFQFQGENAAPVTIESNVWLGANVIVLPGVRISSGVVVGAGAVVTHALDQAGTYVGIPARKVS